MSSPVARCALCVLVIVCVMSPGGPAAAATVALSGPPGARVRLDDRDLGTLPLAGALTLAPGVYRLECRARGYERLAQELVVSDPDGWQHIRLRPLALERGRAVTGSLLYAGLGQWYSGARLRGWVYFLGETGGLLTALAGELQRANYEDDYVNAKAAYDAALTPQEVAFWRAEADQAYADLTEMSDLRDSGLYVAAGAYVLSLLDAWLLFPAVDIGPGLVVPDAHGAADRVAPVAGVHAVVTLGF